MMAVSRLLSGRHRSALSQCRRISEFHLLWQGTTSIAYCIVWFVLSYECWWKLYFWLQMIGLVGRLCADDSFLQPFPRSLRHFHQTNPVFFAW